jgi:beta-lactamase regulating signal transducer with metallopeptidase domain
MNAYPIVPALLLNSASAGLLVVLVLLLQWLFRRHLSPQWRCALWLVVVARLLLPVSVTSPVSLMQWLPRPAAIASPTVPPLVSPRELDVGNSPAGALPRLVSGVSGPGELSPAEEHPADPMGTSAGFHLPAASVLFLWVWLAGGAMLAAKVVRSSLQLNQRLAGGTVVSDPAALALLRSCAVQIGLHWIPRVAECPAIGSPALHGFLRPRLLLPSGFIRDYTPGEQRLVFLHELAHLKRLDLPLNWLVTALQVVHWFNPLVWLGVARWRADREIACDALALEAAGADRSQEYGRTILHLLERNGPHGAGSGLVGILEDHRQLRRRLEMVAGFAPARRRSLTALALAGVLAAVGLTDAQVPPGAPVAAPAAAILSAIAPVPKVGSIGVRSLGLSREELDAVRASLKVREGDALDLSALDEDARALYRTGRYETVQILRNPSAMDPGLTDLTFELTPARSRVQGQAAPTPTVQAAGPNPSLAGNVSSVTIQSDSTRLVGGSFTPTNPSGGGAGSVRGVIALVKPDGTVEAGPPAAPVQYDYDPAKGIIVAQISAAERAVTRDELNQSLRNPFPQAGTGGGNANAGVAARGPDTLSVDFPDEDIRSVLRNVADLFEINIIIPETLQGKTSVKLVNVTWRQIFKAVLDPVGYAFVEEGNIVRIFRPEPAAQEAVTTELMILNFAKAADILPSISGLVGTGGGAKIVIDLRSNALVITDTPQRLGRIRALIGQLDHPAAQHIIETKSGDGSKP